MTSGIMDRNQALKKLRGFNLKSLHQLSKNPQKINSQNKLKKTFGFNRNEAHSTVDN